MSGRSHLRASIVAVGLLAGVAAHAHNGPHDPTQLRLDAPATARSAGGTRQWLAGDHHVHSEFSADYRPDPANPTGLPTPLFGKDGHYPIRTNAENARRFGLSWMVWTDHGGPDHARIDHDIAYPALLSARAAVPDLILFFGMEFDTPAGDHSSLIVPRTPAERGQLRAIESAWSQRETFPLDPARDRPERMIDALRAMRAQAAPPLLIANHPSRSAPAPGGYGRYDPAEFRDWNDTAPNVAVGMEGAPGHQASTIKPDRTLDPAGRRGGYAKVPTMGGFDPMTARLGGLWDALLGEGRRWWITATSDSHANWRDGGNDFWPGEYAKTYVLARRDAADIVDALRHGRIFVTTGDLVSAVNVRVREGASGRAAGLGGVLVIRPGGDVTVDIAVRDPVGPNHSGRQVDLARIDLIAGEVTGPVADRSRDTNPTTRVVRRFARRELNRKGDWLSVRYTFRHVTKPFYLRLRGTNGAELEPATDPAGEEPWSDLWFYANPVFVELSTGASFKRPLTAGRGD